MSEDTVSAVPTKILVPIDFSSSSHTALEVATELAEKFHAELFLLNVVPEIPVVALPEGVTEASIVERGRNAGRGPFRQVQVSLPGRQESHRVKTSVKVGFDVAGTILEAIESDKIDQVVISTHGSSGWYPTVFGSITEKVIKLASCPVLLLRTPKPKSSTKVARAA